MKDKNKLNYVLLIIEKTATALLIVIVIIIIFDLNPTPTNTLPPQPTFPSNSFNFKNSDIPNYGNTPTWSGEERKRPFHCYQITEVRPGPAWKELHIGVTTYQEVTEFLSPEEILWYELIGHLVIKDSSFYSIKGESYIRACFVGDILSAMELYDLSILPTTLDELISAYGNPDRVTWDYFYHNRMLIWAEIGIAASVNLGTDEDEIEIFFMFSPIPLEELEGSWLMQSLPKEGIEYLEGDDNIDFFRLPPELEVEDPWGYNK